MTKLSLLTPLLLLLYKLPNINARLRSSSTSDDCYPCDPECSARKFQGGPGSMGDAGIMYSVSGSADFAKLAFLPVVTYMREVLNIPEKKERAKRGLPKWAIVTEPYLCHTVLQPVLDFFDVVIVHDRLPGDRTNPHHDIADEETAKNRRQLILSDGHNDQSHRQLKNDRNEYLGQGGMSLYSERHESEIRHWVKAFKVYAMANSCPFKRTIFLDVDTIPCKSYFAEELIKMYGDADMGITPNNWETIDTPMSDIRHYEGNSHNSGLVVLNMERPNTLALLKRYEYIFFHDKKRPIKDQPSLGIAMTDFAREGRIDHLDISHKVMCRRDISKERNTKCSAYGGCLLVHKVEMSKVAQGEN